MVRIPLYRTTEKIVQWLPKYVTSNFNNYKYFANLISFIFSYNCFCMCWTFSFKIISHLQKNYKNNIQSSHISFTQISQMILTFCHICLNFLSLLPPFLAHIDAPVVPDSAGGLCKLDPRSSYHFSSFFEHFFLFDIIQCFKLRCTFHATRLESNISPRTLVPFSEK